MVLRKRVIVYTVLWVAVMAVIFFFSNENAEESGARSGAIVSIVESVEEFFGITLSDDVSDGMEFVVRKLAHVFLYTCLGVTAMLMAAEYARPLAARVRTGGVAAAAYALCFLYACTDEWHQTFRSGRSGSFRDVLIDSIGVVLGIGAVAMLFKDRNSEEKKEKSREETQKQEQKQEQERKQEQKQEQKQKQDQDQEQV